MGFLRARFINLKRAAFHIQSIQFSNCPGGIGSPLVLDEPEAA
jgi:hypothetical protein